VTPQKPIIIFGSGWKKVFETLYTEQNQYLNQKYMDLLYFSDSIEEIIQIISNDKRV